MAGQAVAQPANITAHSTALVAQDSDIRGTVSFGPGCIIHPKATIIATHGSIAFGKDCVVEEGAKVVYHGTGTMRIGEGNMFMVGCHVEAPSIGNFNTFQPRSRAPSTINISDYCTLSAGTTLSSAPSNSTMDIDSDNDPVETLEPYTVIYGARSDRRVWDGKNLDAEENLRLKHIEYLREILPKFNRMRPV